jgi:hypothetical protein
MKRQSMIRRILGLTALFDRFYTQPRLATETFVKLRVIRGSWFAFPYDQNFRI